MDKRCPNLYQRARLSTGLTQERAAELLNLSPESLKQYEGGRRIPPDETVARMVEAYRCPWLALEHAQATDRLGVLPKAEPRPLPMASIALRNRLQDATGRLAAIYQVIYSGAKRERPEAATSERSAGEISGVGSTTVGCINYSTRSTPHARPNFAGKGVSL